MIDWAQLLAGIAVILVIGFAMFAAILLVAPLILAIADWRTSLMILRATFEMVGKSIIAVFEEIDDD